MAEKLKLKAGAKVSSRTTLYEGYQKSENYITANMKDIVFDYIKKKYKVSPDYPWKRYPENAVFRHGDNNKWFALYIPKLSGKMIDLVV